MSDQLSAGLFVASTWILPLLIAIPFHEAAHGFVAHQLGDETAWRQGRVTFNPLRHIDPFGTVILPVVLYMTAGFAFGYAKPVPVDFRALRNPRRDMVWVALAGPAINFALAIVASLALHLTMNRSSPAAAWMTQNLVNAILINISLALFNLLPLPPLDGGRVAVGLLPRPLAVPLARLERQGMLILLLLLVILPQVGRHFGRDLDLVGWALAGPFEATLQLIGRLTFWGDTLQ